MVGTVIVMIVYTGLHDDQFTRAVSMKYRLYFQHLAYVLLEELCFQVFWSDVCYSEAALSRAARGSSFFRILKVLRNDEALAKYLVTFTSQTAVDQEENI